MYFKRLKELREDRDKTQDEVAKVLNMKREQYSRYERGVVEIPLSYAILLADYYDVSLDYLVGRRNNVF